MKEFLIEFAKAKQDNDSLYYNIFGNYYLSFNSIHIEEYNKGYELIISFENN